MSPAEYVYTIVVAFHYILNIHVMLTRCEEFSKLVQIHSASNF